MRTKCLQCGGFNVINGVCGFCSNNTPAPVTASEDELLSVGEIVDLLNLDPQESSVIEDAYRMQQIIAQHTRAADGDGVLRNAAWWSAALQSYEKNTTNERKLLESTIAALQAELAECRQVRDDHHANFQLKKQELAECKAEADKVPIMVEQIIELHAIVDAARVYVRDSYAPDAEHDLARFEVLKAALAQVEKRWTPLPPVT